MRGVFAALIATAATYLTVITILAFAWQWKYNIHETKEKKIKYQRYHV
jgi:hypothetical protein